MLWQKGFPQTSNLKRCSCPKCYYSFILSFCKSVIVDNVSICHYVSTIDLTQTIPNCLYAAEAASEGAGREKPGPCSSSFGAGHWKDRGQYWMGERKQADCEGLVHWRAVDLLVFVGLHNQSKLSGANTIKNRCKGVPQWKQPPPVVLRWFWTKDHFHWRIIQALDGKNKECATLKWLHNTFPMLCWVVNAKSIVYIREKAKNECLGQLNLLPLL